MAILTIDEFTEILRREAAERVAERHVFAGDIFLAKKYPQVLTTLRQSLCPQFGLADGNVTIVGSAKMGFSLAPENFPQPFKKKGGDIDIFGRK